ncbi:MAG: hypothetical protein U5R48_05705 [Gammaproteobacteria bacterium]|nr:hypothetical protein [Gammaproteobacteria bacterium]
MPWSAWHDAMPTWRRAQLARWSERLDFPPHERSAVREAIVRQAARQDRLPPGFVHAWPPPDLAEGTAIELIEELARNAVRDRRWDEVRAWMDHLPEATRSKPGWQYWTARSELERTPIRDLPAGAGVKRQLTGATSATGATGASRSSALRPAAASRAGTLPVTRD